jgi:hypothetical protein
MIKLNSEQKDACPETVPWLRDRDLIRGRLNSNDGDCHCLLGWTRVAFKTQLHGKVVDALVARAEEQGLHGASTKGGLRSTREVVTIINDATRNSKGALAKLWNDTMREDFGYKYLMDDDSPLRA